MDRRGKPHPGLELNASNETSGRQRWCGLYVRQMPCVDANLLDPARPRPPPPPTSRAREFVATLITIDRFKSTAPPAGKPVRALVLTWLTRTLGVWAHGCRPERHEVGAVATRHPLCVGVDDPAVDTTDRFGEASEA